MRITCPRCSGAVTCRTVYGRLLFSLDPAEAIECEEYRALVAEGQTTFETDWWRWCPDMNKEVESRTGVAL